MSTLYTCDGVATVTNKGIIKCLDWIATTFDQSVYTDMLQITPESVLYVMSWGMGAVLLPWSLGFVVGVSKRLIDRM